MENLVDKIRFDEKGLVPIIVQDFYNKDVLMIAYANKEAIQKSLETGYAHYYSRSRQKLWKKGETSGHWQKIKQILYDCDGDSILFLVEQKGAACHTNHRSCFYREYFKGEIIEIAPPLERSFNDVMYNVNADSIMDQVYNVLLQRKKYLPEDSYTAKLFKKGINEIIKKIGEETAEFIVALKDEKSAEIIYEATDMLFHMIVAFAYVDIPPSTVDNELKRRFNIPGTFEKKMR